MTAWGQDALLQKAKLSFARGFEEDREGPLFPFWCFLGLEFLSRAAIAKVHPSLLADPSEGGENILSAFGFASPGHQPKSIPARTVFLRCERIIPDFTEVEREACMGFAGLRNAELHSGAPAFDDLKTASWLVTFFRVCRVLIAHLELELNDVFYPNEAEAAEEMLREADEQAKNALKERIGRCRHAFAALRQEDQDGQRAASTEWIGEVTNKWLDLSVDAPVTDAPCPACNSLGLLTGKQVAKSDARSDEGLLFYQVIALPTGFECRACGLEIDGFPLLVLAELGGQFAIDQEVDPMEYFQIDIADYWEPDYGND